MLSHWKRCIYWWKIETIFIVALEKMHILVEDRKWVVWEAKHTFSIFGINITNWLSKTIQRVCNLVFHILWELRVQILKNHENKAKRTLLTFVSMFLICPISNGMFLSQSAPKVLLDPNKDIRFIMELYKLHKIGRKTTRSSLQSKTQTLYFWTNYFKLALKSYVGVLQHGFPYYV